LRSPCKGHPPARMVGPNSAVIDWVHQPSSYTGVQLFVPIVLNNTPEVSYGTSHPHFIKQVISNPTLYGSTTVFYTVMWPTTYPTISCASGRYGRFLFLFVLLHNRLRHVFNSLWTVPLSENNPFTNHAPNKTRWRNDVSRCVPNLDTGN
jgi:hypothetical protein